MSATETRLDRGNGIDSDDVTLLAPDRAWVRSQSDEQETYTVDLSGEPSCTCPDHIYRDETCKHICAVAEESPEFGL